MQGEERYGKIAAISARTAETFRAIDGTSGRIFNQEQALDRLRKTDGTFAKTGRIYGKIIEISGTTVKTGVEIDETYGTTWQAAEATVVKHSSEHG